MEGIINANIYIRDTKNNKFIGYININKINTDIKIGGVYIYEKYIVLEEYYENQGRWFIGGFNVYEYNKDIKITEYQLLGNYIYSSIGEPYWFEGINNDYLFIDIGTGHGVRGIKIFDLKNNKEILNASYNNRFSFLNDIISGLVLTEWGLRFETNENNIEMFNKYKQETPMLEETYGLFQEFILNYNYNIITGEVNIISGEYILTQ
ncbi:MAG: hypothetical protein FWD47_12480 [Treponema sp.]|nr:hypothetical protein [Treponema sp.]